MLRNVADSARRAAGAGLRCTLVLDGVLRDAFVVRYHGRPYAYLNTCRHLGFTLDFGDARFFDDDYDALVCCQHGARYRPETGECFAGPCVGSKLTRLAVEERDGAIWCGPAAGCPPRITGGCPS